MAFFHTPTTMPAVADSMFCERLVRVSCAKMITARGERGGPKLHKNLLVLRLLKQAREEQRRLETVEASKCLSDSLLEDDDELLLFDDSEDEQMAPPLEFSVMDDENGQLDADAPLIFATEATEMCEEFEEPLKAEAPAALSSALNEALAKIGSSISLDRKRKPGKNVAPPQKKTTKTDARAPVSCK